MYLSNILISIQLIAAISAIPVSTTNPIQQQVMSIETENESRYNYQLPTIHTLETKERNPNEYPNLRPRDSIEVVLGPKDLDEAARYARKKFPDKVNEWKQAAKERIISKLTEDKTEDKTEDHNSLGDSDIRQLLEKGDLKIVPKTDELEENKDETPEIKKFRTNVKSRMEDLGVKDFEYHNPEQEYDSFDD